MEAIQEEQELMGTDILTNINTNTSIGNNTNNVTNATNGINHDQDCNVNNNSNSNYSAATANGTDATATCVGRVGRVGDSGADVDSSVKTKIDTGADVNVDVNVDVDVAYSIDVATAAAVERTLTTAATATASTSPHQTITAHEHIYLKEATNNNDDDINAINATVNNKMNDDVLNTTINDHALAHTNTNTNTPIETTATDNVINNAASTTDTPMGLIPLTNTTATAAAIDASLLHTYNQQQQHQQNQHQQHQHQTQQQQHNNPANIPTINIPILASVPPPHGSGSNVAQVLAAPSTSTSDKTMATSLTATTVAAATTATTAAASNTSSRLSQSREENWEHMFNSLSKYKEEQGHCLVPKCYPDNKSLSHWVYRQRSLYMTRQRKGEKKNTLTPDRVDRLRNIGFVFRARSTKEQSEVESIRRKPTSDANWMKNFDILKEFKDSMGHTLVPKIYKKNQTFSSWVYTQRHLYKKRQDGQTNVLTDDRIHILNSISFVWNAKKDRQWQDKDRHRKMEKVKDLWQDYYDKLVEFKDSHGHTMVPKVHKENQALSSWVFRQRKHFRLREQDKAHSMTDQRYQKLLDIKFQFRIRGPRGPNKRKANEIEGERPTNDGILSEEEEGRNLLGHDIVIVSEEEKKSNQSTSSDHATATVAVSGGCHEMVIDLEKGEERSGDGDESGWKGGEVSESSITSNPVQVPVQVENQLTNVESVYERDKSETNQFTLVTSEENDHVDMGC